MLNLLNLYLVYILFLNQHQYIEAITGPRLHHVFFVMKAICLSLSSAAIENASAPDCECEDSGESRLSGRVQSGGDGTHHAPHAPRADAAPQTCSERRVFCGSLHPRAHGRPERAPQPDLWPSAAGVFKLMHCFSSVTRWNLLHLHWRKESCRIYFKTIFYSEFASKFHK